MRTRAALLAIVMLGAALGGASARVQSLSERRHDGVTIQKYDISCGAAAEATLLHLRFGDDVTEQQVALGLIAREEYIKDPHLVRAREGFSLLDLKRYAEQRGYVGEGLGEVSLDDLRDVAPAIVPVALHGYNHFVVFRGFSQNGKVVLADPAFGNRAMTLDRFMHAWITLPDLGHVAFTVGR